MTWREAFDQLSGERQVVAATLCAWPLATQREWREWALAYLEDPGGTAGLPLRALFHSIPNGREEWAPACAAHAARRLEGTAFAWTVRRAIFEAEHAGVDPDPAIDAVLAGEERLYLDRLTLGAPT